MSEVAISQGRSGTGLGIRGSFCCAGQSHGMWYRPFPFQLLSYFKKV